MANKTSGLREKPKQTGRIIALILAILEAIAIFILSSIPGSHLLPGHPEILNVIAHFCEYLIFATLLTIALNSPKRALWISALLALIITSLYGAGDEIHQLFTGRNSDPLDWLTDTCGGIVGAIATIWYISARKVNKSRARDRDLK